MRILLGWTRPRYVAAIGQRNDSVSVPNEGRVLRVGRVSCVVLETLARWRRHHHRRRATHSHSPPPPTPNNSSKKTHHIFFLPQGFTTWSPVKKSLIGLRKKHLNKRLIRFSRDWIQKGLDQRREKKRERTQPVTNREREREKRAKGNRCGSRRKREKERKIDR